MAFCVQKAARLQVGLRTKIVGLLVGILLLLSTAYTVYVYFDQRDRTASEMLEQSRVLVAEMDAVWEFVSINQDAINYTSEGEYDYKGLHCAIVGKSVAALFSRGSDYSISFTNHDPRNFSNAPDPYEEEALSAFESDSSTTEYYGFSEVDGQYSFRYVSVMRVDEHCIECHGGPAGEIDPTGYPKEGWEVGDVAGAVSVIMPTDLPFANMRASIMGDVLFFLALMVLMALIIYAVLSQLVTNPLTSLRSSLALVASKSTAPFVAEGVWASSDDQVRDLYSTREVDDLFEQFDCMAQRLSDLYADLESQVRDRTERLLAANRELDCQRRRVEEINERLARDNRYKSDFLAIVSHELRTPLTSILAFTDLMGDTIDPSDADSRRQLEEIEKNGVILLEMVDNVLETARIQTGSEQVNLELVDLNDIVGMVEASNSPVAVKKGVQMETAVDANVPLIMSDWEKVRRIVVNLVSNAVKFTPAGGCVRLQVSLLPEQERVLVQVSDTGIGIPADKQDLIFERFTQENMSTVRRYGGSGLGLSLVKDLVSMLGGEVGLASEVGKGSVFSVELPVRASQASVLLSPGGEGVSQ